MAQLATNAQCWPWQGTEQAGTCSLDVGQDLGLARLRHYSGTEVAANIVPLASHQCELPVESCASSQFGSPTPFETAGLGKTSTTNIDDLATILLGLGIGDLQSANINITFRAQVPQQVSLRVAVARAKLAPDANVFAFRCKVQYHTKPHPGKAVPHGLTQNIGEQGNLSMGH